MNFTVGLNSINDNINDINDNQIKDSKDSNIILVVNEEIKNKELVINNLAVKKDDEICIDDNESVSNSVIEDEQVTNKPVIEEKKKRTYKPRKK